MSLPSRLAGSSGIIVGKFLPPHRGHQYLIEFARRYVETLTVLVCTLRRDPIPGDLRFGWMREAFPSVNVVHHTDEIPQTPDEDPDFWNMWRRIVATHAPPGITHVFASENYGWKFAETLGATFVPVDPQRIIVPVSGTKVRADPMRHWHDILPPARAYFTKRVCLFGPEATGKSTLAARLAAHFETVAVQEYARAFLAHKDGVCERDDIPLIARGQAATEDALAGLANRVLICDTDLLTTSLWSRTLFGDCPPWIIEEGERRRYDLYLLTDVDAPPAPGQRFYMPGHRRAQFEMFRRALESRNLGFIHLRGSWDARFHAARNAIQGLITTQGGRALR
jgi:NadR type nicotinamide-nucleotide adenylyltransferase